MFDPCVYLFAISFTACNESGLALVSAPSAGEAWSVLKRAGRHNGNPSVYTLVQSKQLGLYAENRYELLLESYTNALVAYDAIKDTIVQLWTREEIISILGYTPADAADLAELNNKADKVVPSHVGNVALLDAEGNLADSGLSYDDFGGDSKADKVVPVQPNSLAILDFTGNLQDSEITLDELNHKLGEGFEKIDLTTVSGADITAILAEGKVPYSVDGTTFWYYVGADDTSYYFQYDYTPTATNAVQSHYRTSVAKSGVWSYAADLVSPEDARNKVTSLSAGSTDVQYPSAKAVYDAMVAGKEIFWATWGVTTANEIAAALTAGKLPVVTYENRWLVFSAENENHYEFGCVFTEYIRTARLRKSDDDWSALALIRVQERINNANKLDFDLITNTPTTLAGYGIENAYTKNEIDAKVSSVYKPAGSAASVAALGSLTAANLGNVYDMSAAFTTTSDFVEGASKDYPAGTNVVIVNTGTDADPIYKYDVLAGFVDLSGYYQFPSGGIPKTDLASAVQTSLGKADTALQSSDITGKEDKSNKVSSWNGTTTNDHYPSEKLVKDSLDAKQDTISDLSTIRSGAAAGATAYQKPGTGIPASDMATGVIPNAVEANPTVPSGTTPTTLTTMKIGSGYYSAPQGPQGPQGEQGNTGSSVDYPYELVNNLTTDDATKGLSAAQGKVLDGKISQLGQEVDAILEEVAEGGSSEELIEGFGEITADGTSDTTAIKLYKPTFAEDVDITKIKFRIINNDGNSFSIKVASAKVNAQSQVVVDTITDAITITPTVAQNSYEDITVELDPFVLPAGDYLCVAVSATHKFRQNTNKTDGTPAALLSFPSGDFSSFAVGSRVSSNIAYVNFNNTNSLLEAYTDGGISIKDIPSRSEMNTAIETALVPVGETTTALANGIASVDGKVNGMNRSLKNSVVVSKYQTEKMAHCGIIRDGGDGYFYVAYYASDTTAQETIGNDIECRLAKVSQYDLHDSQIIPVLRRGETVGNFTQSSDYAPYDPNILIFGNTIRYFMAITESTTPGLGYRDISLSDLSLGNELKWCKIKYTINGTTYTEDATHANLGKMLDRYFGQASGGTIGIYPILTANFIDVSGVKYTFLAGVQAGKSNSSGDWSGAIVKTEDNGATFEVVAWANDLFDARVDYQVWEAGIAYLDGKIYILFKFADTPIAYYDLVNEQWSQLVYLYGYYGQGPSIDNAKPYLELINGKLYAMQNVLPRLETSAGTIYRSRVGCYKLTPVTMEKEEYFEITNDAGCQYFSIINQQGRLYFCFTEDKSHRNYQMKGDISIITIDFLPMPQ